MSQKLEAILSPSRENLFVAIRPGGLDEIEQVIQVTKQNHQKELTLLNAYRDLNRVLLRFHGCL